MKSNRSALLAALLALCLLLGACGKKISPSADEAASPELSEPSSGTASESEESSSVPEEPSDPEPDERELFLQDAQELLEKDLAFTELLVMGGIFEGERVGADKFAARTVSPQNRYYLSQTLWDDLCSVYLPSGAEEYSAYPEYGTKFVLLSGEQAKYSFHFTPAPAATLVIGSAYVKEFGEQSAAVAVPDISGAEHEAGFTLTADGWRLNRPCFFAFRNAEYTPQYTTAGIGSAASLKGECLLINVFIDDGVSSWDEKDIKAELDKVGAAAEFIKSAAASYGSDVRFVITDQVTSPRLSTSEKLPDSPEGFVRIDLLFNSTVFGSLQNYVAEYFELESYENYCVLLHLNKPGRSYALECDSNDFDWEAYSCERALFYRSEDKKYEFYCGECTYAHEILHLFGAVDLYGENISESAAESLAHYYPNDIMSAVGSDIGLYGVSPLTAYLTGMTDALHEQFVFEWE